MIIYGWLKVAIGIFCLGKTCGEVLPRQKMAMATFSQPYICMNKTNGYQGRIQGGAPGPGPPPDHQKWGPSTKILQNWGPRMAVLGRSRSGVPPLIKSWICPWIPKLCMTRTNNLSNTQFRYQLVLFIHIYGWLKVAFGIFYLGKLAVGIFWLAAYFYFNNVKPVSTYYPGLSLLPSELKLNIKFKCCINKMIQKN